MKIIVLLGAFFSTINFLVASSFEPLFDGKSLSGWHGKNPHKYKKQWGPDKIKAQFAKEQIDLVEHWSVKDGVICNDGHGPYLTTDNEYGDVEFRLEYKIDAKSDSGIYLRGSPQVQIWDYREEGGAWRHGAKLGSGGLWNNSRGNAGKDPLMLADSPIGEWNKLFIRQVGARTWVWLNGQCVVNAAIMDNYWNRKKPLAKKGVIHLQTHGAPVYWKNVEVRELDVEESNHVLEEMLANEGSEYIFNGRDLEGWEGSNKGEWIAENGVLSGGKGHLVYKAKEFKDFVLDFQFQVGAGSNNGLLVRYPGTGNGSYAGMCELQVLDDSAEKYNKLDERQYHGSAYGMTAAHRGYQRQVGEWNYQKVTVVGHTIKVELNGTLILDTDLSKVKSTMADKVHPGKDLLKGYLGFAGHGNPHVSFRSIRVKELK